jgi:hypothetical protein
VASLVYERRRPETSTLYHVVQENLDTLYGAVEDGALAIALPKFVRKELEGYLACGLRCHGFARLKCATTPAGPEWRRGALPFERRGMVFERPLCVALDGFTATRAGGHDEAGREALLKYILRPLVAQERVTRGPDGLVRITLKKPFSDGTVAVDLDPLSLLSRLAASVPAPQARRSSPGRLSRSTSARSEAGRRSSCLRMRWARDKTNTPTPPTVAGTFAF